MTQDRVTFYGALIIMRVGSAVFGATSRRCRTLLLLAAVVFGPLTLLAQAVDPAALCKVRKGNQKRDFITVDLLLRDSADKPIVDDRVRVGLRTFPNNE